VCSSVSTEVSATRDEGLDREAPTHAQRLLGLR